MNIIFILYYLWILFVPQRPRLYLGTERLNPMKKYLVDGLLLQPALQSTAPANSRIWTSKVPQSTSVHIFIRFNCYLRFTFTLTYISVSFRKQRFSFRFSKFRFFWFISLNKNIFNSFSYLYFHSAVQSEWY